MRASAPLPEAESQGAGERSTRGNVRLIRFPADDCLGTTVNVVALTRLAHQRSYHKGQLTWPPNWKIDPSLGTYLGTD